MEYRKLTSVEREELKIRHRSERDRRICDRIKDVLLYDKSYSLREILLLNDETIRKHLQDYHDDKKLTSLINDHFQSIVPNHFSNSSC